MFVADQEIRAMLEVGKGYLLGLYSLPELNGAVMSCLAMVHFTRGHPAVRAVVEEWAEHVARCWNEWTHVASPLSREQFRAWLTQQVPFP